MKILITGGAGFIASHITDKYIESGHDVIIVDDLSTGKEKNIHPQARFYKADIRDKSKMEEIFRKEKPDVLNHHAAQMDVRKSVADPKFDAEVNLIGLINLLEAGRVNGLKKVIFASSGGVVYGDAEVLPTPETYVPLKPLSPYGVAKLASEYYLYFYYQTYGIKFTALRYANIYGPRQNPWGEAGVVAIFTKKLLDGEVPVINGDGLQTRDYTFVGDVAEMNRLVLEKDFVGEVNVGTGIETNVNELFRDLSLIISPGKEELHGPAKMGEQKRSLLDASLAAKEFGWKPQVKLHDGFKETVVFFRREKESETK
ncbi:MAG: UDP-glucose 4-epimerase [Candidatus Gottesmanbacteria bacterium GW2011_GWC2_39_8]|uniref:UDP-glucose 4-epimerase n=1 Tax=Candidatus Gottesmanbacteria bacterium GW2011_GWC2_39_8 TaxID=1618450 RepID=A0A0G0QAE2_9BACT|nr:MAG: UDP-glucose 4-epimerase [Candidatus Gottesmanbacteria bacterium GW2011_GWC2_39_8]